MHNTAPAIAEIDKSIRFNTSAFIPVSPVLGTLVPVLVLSFASSLSPGSGLFGLSGFAGCSGYAAALAAGTAAVGLCSPGGPDVAEECAEILGVSAGSVEKKVAVIQCAGVCDVVDRKLEYDGIDTCQAVSLMFAGDSACQYGCLGHGDCAAVCPENAITICNGLATVNEDLCVGCGLCAKACPKNVIIVVPQKFNQHVRCLNKDKGAETRKTCKVGCIGCMKCQKNCPSEAITVTNNFARVDYSKCTGCGVCAEGCPVKCIQMV